jgi:hypothetical protein
MTALRNRPAAQRRLAFVLSVELFAIFLGGLSRRAEALVYLSTAMSRCWPSSTRRGSRRGIPAAVGRARAGAESRLCARARTALKV